MGWEGNKNLINIIHRTPQTDNILSLWDIKSLAFYCLSSGTALDQVCWRQLLPRWPHSYKKRAKVYLYSLTICQNGMDLLDWAISMLKEPSNHIQSWDMQLHLWIIWAISNDLQVRWKWAHIFGPSHYLTLEPVGRTNGLEEEVGNLLKSIKKLN